MKRSDDRDYLMREQYRDASRLRARIALHDRFSVNKQGWFSWLCDHLALPPESRILELGCGPATLWAEGLAARARDWSIYLTDLSLRMVQDARLQLSGGVLSAGFAVADAQNIPAGAGCFDAVLANHMLYHVPSLGRALAEIRRVLKPTGVLYASTNGQSHLVVELGYIVDPGGSPGQSLEPRRSL